VHVDNEPRPYPLLADGDDALAGFEALDHNNVRAAPLAAFDAAYLDLVVLVDGEHVGALLVEQDRGLGNDELAAAWRCGYADELMVDEKRSGLGTVARTVIASAGVGLDVGRLSGPPGRSSLRSRRAVAQDTRAQGPNAASKN
jgi:hypothetical protein